MSIVGFFISILALVEFTGGQICQRYECKDDSKTTTNCLYENTESRKNGIVDTYPEFCSKSTYKFLIIICQRATLHTVSSVNIKSFLTIVLVSQGT